MKFNWIYRLSFFTGLALTITGCAPKMPVSNAGSDQPTLIKGNYEVTNSFVLSTYYLENAVALTDMHGFVVRDLEWELPVESQVLGFMTFNPDSLKGTYELSLPTMPRGEFNDVDQNGKKDRGVQIFAIAYSPNQAGGPFSEGDDLTRGWPTYLASVKTESDNKNEVIGGWLIVWSPDENQQFPVGFGQDGLLFTQDDPVVSIQAGYSVVDMEQYPFAFIRKTQLELALYEPSDIAIKDFSKLSYTEAFDKMFEFVRNEYAFSDVRGKAPDWGALNTEIRLRVLDSEMGKDPNEFYLALRDFTWAFNDGHVSLDGGQYAAQDFQTVSSGGYGFSIRELDDGRVIVNYVLDGGPASIGGMQVGAQVIEFNNMPIQEAIEAAQSYSNQSSDFAIRYQKARYLLRAQPGTTTDVAFINPGGSTQILSLQAVAETESFSRSSLYYGVDLRPLVPVESKIITERNSQTGYVRINSNSNDLNLIVRLFEHALKQFESRQVGGIIIDMRYNPGGAPLGLAGFLTDQEIPLGQLEYYSSLTGQFEPAGLRELVRPKQHQYRFDKMVLLVGPACASACEIEAYGFSQVPGMIVAGQYPTAGIEADTARGEYHMPEGFIMRFPTGKMTLPDGSIFLESQGVQPTLRVPIDEVSVLSSEDLVLQIGLDAILVPLGTGVTPSGPPQVASQSEAEDILSSNAPQLEQLAHERYDSEAFSKPGIVTYSVTLSEDTVLWVYAWCALDSSTLQENFEHIRLKFDLDGKEIPLADMSIFEGESSARQCRLVYTALNNWPAGEHHIRTTATFTETIDDGTSEFDHGEYILNYIVYVSP